MTVPDIDRLPAFLAAALVLAVIPGPGMLYVFARSVGGGWLAGARSSLGTTVGGAAHVAAAALGISAILATSATAFAMVKYIGAAYLVYLGVRTLLRRKEASRSGPAGGPSDRKAFRQGVATEALNPKTALFFLAFLPHFVDPAAGSVAVQSLALGLLSVTLNTLADLVVAALAGTLAGRALRTRRRRWPQLVSGSTLVALGGYAVIES
ncbi:LysE family translocator [Carbonactinospora thermoautotrophica]|uniref:LysE family translocator n=1 Tax=Carbonactinospora thermoautotrophica TaxID=1469144 RepID=UPI00226F18CB|nr:LysE family translocator [Carbonactinospora thermoautotrophica]